MPFARSWFPMVSLYYACMRETEADSNGGCGGGFDTGLVAAVVVVTVVVLVV